MTNQEFLKSLESPKAQFYLCDFHVHSPASYDIRTGKRFAALSSLEREKIEQIPEEMAGQLEDYEYKALELFPVHLYYDLLLKRRNQLAEQWGLSPGEDWAFMAITDHNVCRYSHLLAKHAWTKRNENRFIVFPGIELTVRFDVSKDLPTVAHILCVFEPLTDRSSIRIAICDASGTPEWSPGLPELKVESLPDFVNKIRSHDLYPAICISAHVGSSKGVQYASTRCILNNLDAEIIRTQSSLDLNPDQDARQAREHIERLKRRRSPDAVSLEVLELIGQCGFDALQIAEEQDKVHYNSLHRFRPDFGRSVPILCSDAHRVEDVFNCSGAVSFLKLSRVSSTIDRRVLFHDVRDKALKYGETRYSYTYPGKVSEWIEGIRITPNATTPSRFWPFRSDSPFVLSFSRNLNCLIGGRGSGKSALIEALAYGLNTEEPNELDPKNIDAQDWYKRAKATLNGCQVDVCYKSTSGALGDLPKKVIFSGRYFREPIRERAVRYSNKDDTELFSQNIEVPRVQILRIHEIEKAAEPDKLRELFDSFCGNQIKVLEKQISDTKQQLVDQRRRIVRVVEQLVELVEDGSPLSDYVNRFRRYNEVNHPDMQVKYQNVDNAYEAEKIAREAIQTWNEIDYNSLKIAIESFFKIYSNKIYEEGSVKSFCDSLKPLFSRDCDEALIRETTMDALDGLDEAMQNVLGHLESASTSLLEVHTLTREELIKKGLPEGAQDRDAKKKDLEAADEDLLKYRQLVSELMDNLFCRHDLYSKLQGLAKNRSRLRSETGSLITSILSRNLNPAALQIEVDAQARKDDTSVLEWLLENLGPSLTQHRKKRLVSLLEEKGESLIEELRWVLFDHVAVDEREFFTVATDKKVSEGRIDHKDAESMLGSCICMYRVYQDFSPDLPPQLPKELLDGLWHFPTDGKTIDRVLKLDELIFDDSPEVRLNDRPNQSGSQLRPLTELSAGQRCSAILPILLLTGTSPIIIDQPEDNLDNRLIRQIIVGILSNIKLRRQVILATHNPNLPVLGDAEQVIVLEAIEEKKCKIEALGDLDLNTIVSAITDIMEGGRDAFQYRQSIYQSHWHGGVAAEKDGSPEVEG